MISHWQKNHGVGGGRAASCSVLCCCYVAAAAYECALFFHARLRGLVVTIGLSRQLLVAREVQGSAPGPSTGCLPACMPAALPAALHA